MHVRFRARVGHRVELADAPGPDIRIGTSPVCQVILHHPSVADVHAHLLLRRNRLIVRDSGRGGAHLSAGGTRLTAPILLNRDRPLMIGDVEVHAWPTDLPGLPLDAPIQAELESRCRLCRRYRLDEHTEALFTPRIDPARVWSERTPGTRSAESSHLAKRGWVQELDGHLLVPERVPQGLRLGALVDATGRGALSLSVSAAVVVTGHSALGLSAHHAALGPHGSVDPEHIHLGLDGSVLLVQAGLDPIMDPRYVAPERRLGLGPSTAADAYAWARIALDLFTRAGDARLAHDTLRPFLVRNPQRRSTNVAQASARLCSAYFAAGHDAGPQDVGRRVRLLVSDRPSPLLGVNLAYVAPRRMTHGRRRCSTNAPVAER